MMILASESFEPDATIRLCPETPAEEAWMAETGCPEEVLVSNLGPDDWLEKATAAGLHVWWDQS